MPVGPARPSSPRARARVSAKLTPAQPRPPSCRSALWSAVSVVNDCVGRRRCVRSDHISAPAADSAERRRPARSSRARSTSAGGDPRSSFAGRRQAQTVCIDGHPPRAIGRRRSSFRSLVSPTEACGPTAPPEDQPRTAAAARRTRSAPAPALGELVRARSSACGPRPARRRAAACAGARTSSPAGSRRRRRRRRGPGSRGRSTRSATFGAATLIAEISIRACLLPTVSISHAAFIVSSRAISISIRDSAIQSWMLRALGDRLAERDARRGAPAHQLERPLGRSDRAHAVVDAPGPEPRLGDQEPVALVGDQVRRRDATSSKSTSRVALLVDVAEHRQVAHDR